jgi:hypothetical protein
MSVGSPPDEKAALARPDRPSAIPWQPGGLAHLVLDAVMLAVVAGYLYLAASLGFGTTGRAGAGFFPVVAGSLCAGFLAIDLGRLLVGVARGQLERGSGRVVIQVWVILAVVVLYIALVEPLGHAITASIVAAILIATLGARPIWVTVLAAIATGFGTELLFAGLLGLRLPAGIFDISILPWI